MSLYAAIQVLAPLTFSTEPDVPSLGLGLGLAVGVGATLQARLAFPLVVAIPLAVLAALIVRADGVEVDMISHEVRAWATDDVFGLVAIAPAVMLLSSSGSP